MDIKLYDINDIELNPVNQIIIYKDLNSAYPVAILAFEITKSGCIYANIDGGGFLQRRIKANDNFKFNDLIVINKFPISFKNINPDFKNQYKKLNPDNLLDLIRKAYNSSLNQSYEYFFIYNNPFIKLKKTSNGSILIIKGLRHLKYSLNIKDGNELLQLL